MKIIPTQSWLTPLVMLLSSSAASAQNATPQPRIVPTVASTIVLTPFEISSAKDNGYAATESLAGTRLRTELRDIGASLNILTPEFMRDLGVNSFDQALLYTPSVDASEGDNTDNNRASGNQMRFGTGQSYSIRGFNTNAGNQSASHDFFTALDPAGGARGQAETCNGPVGTPQR